MGVGLVDVAVRQGGGGGRAGGEACEQTPAVRVAASRVRDLTPSHVQRDNSLGPEGAGKLAPALGKITALTSLNLVRLVCCDGGMSGFETRGVYCGLERMDGCEDVKTFG